MEQRRKHHTSRHLMKNDTVMAYLKRVAHYETTKNIKDHIFTLTGWDVREEVIAKVQGGINYVGVQADKKIISQRVLWDRILMLAKQGFNREQIIDALGISKHLMTRLERLHRVKIDQ